MGSNLGHNPPLFLTAALRSPRAAMRSALCLWASFWAPIGLPRRPQPCTGPVLLFSAPCARPRAPAADASLPDWGLSPRFRI